MTCRYCEEVIVPYQPGTVWVEKVNDNFVAHESCYQQDNEEYRTADSIIAEAESYE